MPSLIYLDFGITLPEDFEKKSDTAAISAKKEVLSVTHEIFDSYHTVGPLITESLLAKERVSTRALDDPLVVQT